MQLGGECARHPRARRKPIEGGRSGTRCVAAQLRRCVADIVAAGPHYAATQRHAMLAQSRRFLRERRRRESKDDRDREFHLGSTCISIGDDDPPLGATTMRGEYVTRKLVSTGLGKKLSGSASSIGSTRRI